MSQTVRVVALSGGYSREEANERLSRQRGMVASFSRALSEGLSAKQPDAELNGVRDRSIHSIFEASRTLGTCGGAPLSSRRGVPAPQ